jgi:hypothetical protein
MVVVETPSEGSRPGKSIEKLLSPALARSGEEGLQIHGWGASSHAVGWSAFSPSFRRDINMKSLSTSLSECAIFDLGLGTRLTFSSNQHQGSHKVWGTQLDEAGHYQPIDLE